MAGGLWRLRTRSAEETAALGRRLGLAAQPGDMLLLQGPVGAGKTVLASGILEGLGVPGPHPSPTFTLLRTYRGRLPAVHADLYRLEGRFDPDELGWEDAVAGEGVTIVEWADRLGGHAPADALHIRLEPAGAARSVACRAGGPSAARLLAAARGAVAG